MPRSLSKSQIDKLGERLAKESPAREEDLKLLGAFRAEYWEPLLRAQALIRKHDGIEPAYRLKTNATIIEKLRRSRTRLSSMQDVGGLRVVIAGALDEQDRVVERLASLFRGAKLEDRRARPSAGYRAMHLIIELDSFPLEIQVRTRLQDFWAQMFERLADRLGRGIRYGEPPLRPDAIVGTLTSQQVVHQMMEASGFVAAAEKVRTELTRLEAELVPLTRQQSSKDRYQVRRLHRRVEEIQRLQSADEASLISTIERVASGSALISP